MSLTLLFVVLALFTLNIGENEAVIYKSEGPVLLKSFVKILEIVCIYLLFEQYLTEEEMKNMILTLRVMCSSKFTVTDEEIANLNNRYYPDNDTGDLKVIFLAAC